MYKQKKLQYLVRGNAKWKYPCHYLSLFFVTVAFTTSCTSINQKKRDQQTVSSNVKIASSQELFGINGENISIRENPSGKSKKIINEKATQALGTIQYCEVDHSVKVKVLETKDDWTKIKVIKPEWLSASHIGWIPKKYLLSKEDEEKRELKKLDPKEYEIMKTEHNQAVQNFHILLKHRNSDKNYVYQFVKQFRKENCRRNCNVCVYDTRSILPLVDIYPLEANDYIELADHFIAMSTFDATETIDWYPYQDFKYKEYHGKNWKKEPIK